MSSLPLLSVVHPAVFAAGQDESNIPQLTKHSALLKAWRQAVVHSAGGNVTVHEWGVAFRTSKSCEPNHRGVCRHDPTHRFVQTALRLA